MLSAEDTCSQPVHPRKGIRAGQALVRRATAAVSGFGNGLTDEAPFRVARFFAAAQNDGKRRRLPFVILRHEESPAAAAFVPSVILARGEESPSSVGNT